MAKSLERLRGYSIRVSNSTNLPGHPADVCYTDDMSQLSMTEITEDCNGTARYLWFYQPHVRDDLYDVPMLEICEVKVFGK